MGSIENGVNLADSKAVHNGNTVLKLPPLLLEFLHQPKLDRAPRRSPCRFFSPFRGIS